MMCRVKEDRTGGGYHPRLCALWGGGGPELDLQLGVDVQRLLHQRAGRDDRGQPRARALACRSEISAVAISRSNSPWSSTASARRPEAHRRAGGHAACGWRAADGMDDLSAGIAAGAISGRPAGAGPVAAPGRCGCRADLEEARLSMPGRRQFWWRAAPSSSISSTHRDPIMSPTILLF